MELRSRKKKLWIGLLIAASALAIAVGILVYADFGVSFFIVPLVVDERMEIRSGIAWMLFDSISRLLR